MNQFTLLYETTIRPRIDQAIEDALRNEVSNAAVDAIEKSANQRVYGAYSPVINTRRFSLLGDNTYNCDVQGSTLIITAETTFQGSKAQGDLGEVIEKGLSNYRMPFPRPWMEEAIKDNFTEIENALGIGMQRQGF